jgi:hypothetical protein
MARKQAKRARVWRSRRVRLIEALESRVLLTTSPMADVLDAGAPSLPSNAAATANYGQGTSETLGSTTVTTATTYIDLDSTGANIQIYNSSTPTGTPMTFPVGSLSSIIVSPTTGNDLLVIDYSNGDPVPSGGITYTGAGGSGGNTLQILGATASDAFTLNAGSVAHGNSTVLYSNVLSLTVGTGTFTATADLNLLGVTVNTQATLNATTTEHIGQLSVNSGGAATLEGFFGNTIVNGSLQFAPNGTDAATSGLNNLLLAGSTNNWTGQLDLTNNKLVVETTAANKAATLATLTNQVLYGLTHSTGIMSTDLPAGTIIAVIDAATTSLTTFGGLPVDANSILIGPELAGDANVDGQVDLTDLSTVLNNFGSATPNWTSGNFDNAGTVDLTDLSDVLNNFGLMIPNPSVVSSPVPPTAGSPTAVVPAGSPGTPAGSSNSAAVTIPTSPLVIPGSAASDDGTPVIVASSAPVVAPKASIAAPTVSTVSSQVSAPIATPPISVTLPSSWTVSLRTIKPAATVHLLVHSLHVQSGPKIGTVTYTFGGHTHVLGVGDRKLSLDLARPDA